MRFSEGIKAVIGRSALVLFVLLASIAISQQAKQTRAINLQAINSPYSDLAPIISADGNTMYFTSNRPGGVGGQDFWMSRRVGGEWTTPVNITSLNTPQNEGPDTITADEKTMYYTGCNRRPDGSDKCDIYVSYKDANGVWTPGKNIGPPINTDYEEANASVSPDGKILYFTSNRPGGQGGYDIWMSVLQPNGKWGQPINLGPTINTPMWEGIAFAAADGVTLYFSSNGHGGFGNADVFKTTRKPDGSWTEPENLGGLINSPYNDIYFTFPASGDYAYFSSSAEEGLGQEDIYAIPKKLILESRDYVVVRGRVYDQATNQPVAAMLTFTGGQLGREQMTSNPRTGAYTMRLKIGSVYSVNASASGYLDRAENLDLRVADPFKIIVKDIPLSPVVAEAAPPTHVESAPPEEMEEILIDGGRISVGDVLFDFDKYSIKSEAIPILERLVKFMQNNPSVVLKIDGYTDSFGTNEYNMKLSIRRANAVKNYLVLRGIPASRIVTQGHGESNLVAPDDPNAREGNPKNRRVEFSLVRGTYKPTTNPNTSMRGKEPPTVVTPPQPQTARVDESGFDISSEIEVVKAEVAVNVVDRTPVKVGKEFPNSVGTLYFFTRVVGADEPIKVTHLWYYGDRLVSRVYLDVASPDFRTWSLVRLSPKWVGPMRVECVGPDGKVLATVRFTVTK